jgi:hypothetical protein
MALLHEEEEEQEYFRLMCIVISLVQNRVMPCIVGALSRCGHVMRDIHTI